MLRAMLSLLTVSLLAVTLAAATAHSSKNLPNLNAAGKLNADWIPYYECMKSCQGSCLCDRAAPAISRCLCGSEDESVLQLKGQKEKNSDLIPYTECMKTCDHCSCTKMWPPESNWCTCSDDSLTKKKEVAAVAVQKVNAVLFPREECDENCKYSCACTLIWPPPKYCSCAEPIEKTATCSENCEGVCVCDSPENCSCSTDIKLHKKPKVEAALFPYAECDDKCNVHCICALIWPPPEYCVCGDPIKPSKKTASELKAIEKTTGEGSFIPYPECISKCAHECVVCTLNLPIEKSLCWCSNFNSVNSKKQSTKNSVEKIRRPGGGFIPYPECIAKCDRCTTCTRNLPIEASFCICENDDVSRPVKKTPRVRGGFIPYPECIAKCDRCTTCTRNLPIEASFCICENDDVTSGPVKKVTGGADKKMVLWTRAKMETISYDECVKTCEQCACTLPWPPESAICICVTPKHQAAAGGKALPM